MFLFAILFVITPVHAQLLSDATGLAKKLDVETGGHIFEIETISNFDIKDFDFNKDEKKLSLYIVSGLENNLGEIIIPQNFLSGNFTFYLNDQEFSPKIKSNDSVSFITLNFTGSGNNQVEIFGTTILMEYQKKILLILLKQILLMWILLLMMMVVVAV